MTNPHHRPVTARELALVLKDWLIETVNQELETRLKTVEREGEELGQMLRRNESDAAKKIRARRFREAMAGLETTLMGQQEIEYRMVLDHILQNIGASLQALGLLMPEMGLVDPPEFDFRNLPVFPAVVSPRRYVALPRLGRALAQIGLARGWAPNAHLFLVEYREFQPRLFFGPKYDDERMGLFAWSDVRSKEVCFFPMSRVPGAELVGTNELVMLGQRTSLINRLLDSDPPKQEYIARLATQEFMLILRALLLDYEALHTMRQREVAEQDQLGTMLWDFLSREE